MYTQPDPDAYLASYVENYLRQEVLEEGRTRNLATFSRFLESASFSQAAPLNVAEVARDVGVDRKIHPTRYLPRPPTSTCWRTC